MRALASVALSLVVFGISQAEDVVLPDGRVVRAAAIGAPLPDGSVVVSGKDETGIDYAARVPLAMLPQSIRIRLAVEPASVEASVPAPTPTPTHEAIELGKPDVRKLHEEGGEVFFAWKVVATNSTGTPMVFRSSISILNKDEFPIADAVGEQRMIGPRSTETFSGSSSVKAALWKMGDRFSVRLLP